MNQTRLLLDSSAVVARAKGEAGAEDVDLIVHRPPEGGLFIHAVNVCEVAYQLIKFGLVESLAYQIAIPPNVAVIDDIPLNIWRRTASLKARYKDLALGDCIAIAQAEEIHADILTGDRGFLRVETFIGIKLFR